MLGFPPGSAARAHTPPRGVSNPHSASIAARNWCSGAECSMPSDLNRVIAQVSKEKGIDRDIIVKTLEEAMLLAARKTFGHEKNIEAKFNTDLGEGERFGIRTVVEAVEDAENQVTLSEARAKLDPDAEVGDELLAKLSAAKFGRIAAQAAKH